MNDKTMFHTNQTLLNERNLRANWSSKSNPCYMTSSNGSYLGKAPTEKSSCGSEDGEEVANDAEYGASQVKSMPHRAASHEY